MGLLLSLVNAVTLMADETHPAGESADGVFSSCVHGTCLEHSDGCHPRYDCCNGPGTLMQWSYGNSFSGGPDLESPLVTDRPDFTEATSAVGRGVAQLEIGYTYTFDNAFGPTRSLLTWVPRPSTFFRQVKWARQTTDPLGRFSRSHLL